MHVARILMIGGGVVASGLVARQLAARSRRSSAGSEGRWRTVTIERPIEHVAPGGRAPAPLESLGDLVDVRVTEAPGGRGTELSARLRAGEPGALAGAATRLADEDPRQQVRRALRESKQLLEVGEVLQLHPRPHGRRTVSPGGVLLDFAIKRSDGEGVL